jgi:hypothetical protein
MKTTRRRGALLATMVTLALAVLPVAAVDRDVVKDVRGEYEGRALRLRLDLNSAIHSLEPNVLSLDGMGHGRERSQVIFNRLESVYLQRVMSEGATRLTLTIFRTGDNALRLRSSAVPPSITGIPSGSQSTATYAASDSTAVALELQAGKKDPVGQRREIQTLLERLFYLGAEPTREELTSFVATHREWPVSRLAALTGLTPETVREVLAALGP